MVILAIETSTTCGSVALLRDGSCVFQSSFASERSHNSQIFAPLAEALEIATPELIAVGTGPGSYTGARIGIAAGIGISLTCGATLIGIPSVAAAEIPDPQQGYHLIGDARRGSYFYAEVEDRQLVRDPELIDRPTLEQLLRCEGRRFITFDAQAPATGIEVTKPSAEILARIAERLTPAQVEALAAAPVVPHYMGAPFVTAAKPRKG